VTPDARTTSYGEDGLTIVDRLGVWLSRRAIDRHLPDDASLRVLDLGCGHDATLLRALGGRVGQGTGVDVSISAEARAATNLTFLEMPIGDALGQIADASQDVVLLINVLEHLWEAQETLAACHRVLAPGGTLLVNVPTWRGKTALEISAFRFGLSPATEMDDHKRYYDRRDLWPMLVVAGFAPSAIHLRYHKLTLNLFARARRSP
jgi:SAM-dependent methyltransferase